MKQKKNPAEAGPFRSWPESDIIDVFSITDRIIPESSENPEMRMSKKYKVYVDDNFHYMDESERYAVGSYDSLEKAIEKCKKITIRSLRDLCEREITPEKLSAQWSMFGEDPYIVGGDGSVPFSARKFVSIELCREIIKSRNLKA